MKNNRLVVVKDKIKYIIRFKNELRFEDYLNNKLEKLGINYFFEPLSEKIYLINKENQNVE